MIETIFLNVLWQVIAFIGCVYLVGFLISLINRLFYKLANYSRAVVYGTGFIGTPVHETSHLLMCLLFFHKVHKVKFFQINDEDGVLGYVSHSWNPKNIYQQIGNYFIGIAPIVVGTLIIFLGMKQFLPVTYGEIDSYFAEFAVMQEKGFSWDWFGYIFSMFGGMTKAIFAEFSIGWQWWVFMVISLCIAIHMNLSGADIKGSLVAIPIMIVVFIAVNLVLGLVFGSIYGAFIETVNVGASFLLCTLILSLALSVLCLAVAIVIKLIILLIKTLFGIGR